MDWESIKGYAFCWNGKMSNRLLYVAVPTAGLLAGCLVWRLWKRNPLPIVKNPDDEYDYVIIGGGSAGSVLAARLSEDPKNSVLLLEAGGSYDESIKMKIPVLYSLLFKSEYDWSYTTVPQKTACFGLKDNTFLWPRGKVLGGTSVLNGLEYARGSRFDFDGWEADGCTGWGYDNVLPYFLKSEDIQIDELKNSLYHHSGGPLAVSTPNVTRLADVYLQAGKEMGYSLEDYNGQYMKGFNRVQLNTRKGVRSSTGLEFLGKKSVWNKLHISLRSFVTKLEIQNKTATGVHFKKNGQEHFVKARKEVILSGGAINSPQILMLSGIGPKEHLEEMGIPVVVDLPVGENLQDHYVLPMFTTIEKRIGLTEKNYLSLYGVIQHILYGTGTLSYTGVEGSAFFHFDPSQEDTSKPDIQVIFFSAYNHTNFFNYTDTVAKEYLSKHSDVHGFTTVIIATQPKSKGSLKLQSDDPYSKPILDPRYLSEQSDVDVTIKGIRIWEKILQTPVMKEIGTNINTANLPSLSEHCDFRSDAYWERFVRHVGLPGHHQCGTCKMGKESDSTTVVTPELKVKGIQNLRVVDASIFSNITSANTNAPVIMVAEKAADMIRGKCTVEHLKRVA